MRVNSLMMAGAAVLFAACGGGDTDTAADTQATAGTDAPAAAAPAPTGTGTTHEVQMVLEGTEYKYVPEHITVKPGDVIRYINASGGPHNVSFWADSIPAGAEQALSQAMGETMGPLQGALMVEPNAEYVISLPTTTPVGEYKYYCTPHLALGMTASMTVEQ